jgi:hypothetical protein
MRNMNIRINLIYQTSNDLSTEIISQINTFVDTCNVTHRFRSSTRYDETS